MTDATETKIGSKAAAQRWQAFDGRGLKAPADCIDFAVVDVSTGKEVARVWEQADAIRLTAFPDLLEALKASTTFLRLYANSLDLQGGATSAKILDEQIALNRAAIQRAEGQGT